MLHVIGIYLAVVGGAAAGAQVARGAVRGAGRLVRGDPRGALTEVAGGLAAPVVSAVHQFSRLGSGVCQSAAALNAEVRHMTTRPDAAPPANSPRQRKRGPATAASGAA
jgi:hypothetical protein